MQNNNTMHIKENQQDANLFTLVCPVSPEDILRIIPFPGDVEHYFSFLYGTFSPVYVTNNKNNNRADFCHRCH